MIEDKFRVLLEEANHLQMSGKYLEGLQIYASLLGSNPDNPFLISNCAYCLAFLDKKSEARDLYRKAWELAPKNWDFCSNYLHSLVTNFDFQEAIQILKSIRSVFANTPQYKELSVDILLKTAGHFHDLGDIENERECLEELLILFPEEGRGLASLGVWYLNQGYYETAKSYYARSLQFESSHGKQIRYAMMLPPVYFSIDQLLLVRERYEQEIDKALENGCSVQDPLNQVGTVPFYLAYQGLNDIALQKKLAKLLKTKTHPSKYCMGVSNGKKRIGVVSTLLGAHSVGHFYGAIMAQLNPEKFETIFFKIDRSISVQEWCEKIKAANLHVLVYPEIGMDPSTFFLAQERLAPVQCVLSGHAQTTGFASMDYFLSSHFNEQDDADSFYSEKLVRLDAPLGFYKKIEQVDNNGEEKKLLFQKEGPILLCPMTLFKVHPDFDFAIGSILARLPTANLYFFKMPSDFPRKRLLERWSRTIPDVLDRIHFIPAMEQQMFFAHILKADLLLDTFHFSGGNTGYQVLGLGKIMVTWPSPFLRGRFLYGLYKQMNCLFPVAKTQEEYVEKVVQLVVEKESRMVLEKEITLKAHSLFEDMSVVRAYEAFFLDVAHFT